MSTTTTEKKTDADPDHQDHYEEHEAQHSRRLTSFKLDHVAKLYQVSRVGQNTEVKEVPMAQDSLDEGHAFVLDAGRTIYIWFGEHCSPFARNAANALAENKEEQWIGGGVCTATHDIDDLFWDMLKAPKVTLEAQDPATASSSSSSSASASSASSSSSSSSSDFDLFS